MEVGGGGSDELESGSEECRARRMCPAAQMVYVVVPMSTSIGTGRLSRSMSGDKRVVAAASVQPCTGEAKACARG